MQLARFAAAQDALCFHFWHSVTSEGASVHMDQQGQTPVIAGIRECGAPRRRNEPDRSTGVWSKESDPIDYEGSTAYPRATALARSRSSCDSITNSGQTARDTIALAK